MKHKPPLTPFGLRDKFSLALHSSSIANATKACKDISDRLDGTLLKSAPYSSSSCNFDLMGVCGGGLTTNTGQGCSLGSRGFGYTSVGISVALPVVASMSYPAAAAA